MFTTCKTSSKLLYNFFTTLLCSLLSILEKPTVKFNSSQHCHPQERTSVIIWPESWEDLLIYSEVRSVHTCHRVNQKVRMSLETLIKKEKFPILVVVFCLCGQNLSQNYSRRNFYKSKTTKPFRRQIQIAWAEPLRSQLFLGVN